MAIQTVKLVATEGVFRGLAKQNMLFHHCIGELVDNAIAATRAEGKFRVDIIFSPGANPNVVQVDILDNGKGMTTEHLGRALQLGESASTTSRLNEHGFGLKNALATLSGGNGFWKIWSKPFDGAIVSSVEGPFKDEMVLRDDDIFPTDAFLPADFVTLIRVPVEIRYVQTVQGRGAPAKDLAVLRDWLIEHLGVMYRGYLEQDPVTFDAAGVIVVSIGTDRVSVPPVSVPFADRKTDYIDIELGGATYRLRYLHGTLDEVKRDVLVKGKKARYYYQKNIPSQGIDIRLGKRVIATRQFETIWKTADGQSQLSRHNNFNDFVGELVIPELPRGILTTVNNKTDFNLDDPDWAKIFDRMNVIRPPEQVREKSEAQLRKKWMSMLKATNGEDIITDEVAVWPTGTFVDIYRKTAHGKIILYELKVGSGAPQHLYQLKMYWDGLVIDKKEHPTEAVLLVEEFGATLEQMANMMNQMTPPAGSNPYNFKIERLRDKGL
jgi:hypothetical protein